jgi:hypothetical protein
MIAKVQSSRQNSRSSFRRLLDYLTKERDPDTGETRLRGDVVLSSNLGYLVRDQARHLRPIHGPGDARRLLPGTTPRESSPTPSCATAFHRNQAQNRGCRGLDLHRRSRCATASLKPPAGCPGATVTRCPGGVSASATGGKHRRQTDNCPSQNSHGPAVFQNIDSRGKAAGDHRASYSTPANCIFGATQQLKNTQS